MVVVDLAVLRTSRRVVVRVNGEDLTAVLGFGLMITDPGRGPTEVLFAKLAWRQGDPEVPGDKVHSFPIGQGAVVQSIGYGEPCMCPSISLQLKPLEITQ